MISFIRLRDEPEPLMAWIIWPVHLPVVIQVMLRNRRVVPYAAIFCFARLMRILAIPQSLLVLR